ncbi:hypothetical protein AAC387_Pa08g2145 [Persea americana]
MAEQAARPSPFRFRFWGNPTPAPQRPPAPPQPAIPAQRPVFRPFTSPLQPQPQMPRPQAPPPAAPPSRPVATALPQPQFVSPIATSPPTSQPMPPASQTLSKDTPQTETQSLEKTTNQTTEVESQSTPNVAPSLDIPITRAIADTTEGEKEKLKTDSERKTEAAEDGRKPETETRAEAAQEKKPETETRAEAAEEEKWKTMVETKPEALKDELSKTEEETKPEATEEEKPKMELVETKREAIEDELETESETKLDATEGGELIEEPKASAKEIQKEQGDGESISYAESGSKTQSSTDQLTTDQKDVTSSNSDGKATETLISSDPNERIAASETGASDSTSQATLNKSTQEDVATITDEQDADLVKQPEGERASHAAEGSMSEGHNSVNQEGAVLFRRGSDHNKDEGPPVINSNGEGGSEGKMYHLRNGTKPFPAIINSNFQTFNNSIVFKSSYKENSPGVHLVVYSNPIDPVDPKKTWETLVAHKAEMETTPVQNLMYEPDASLRGIAVEYGVSEA